MTIFSRVRNAKKAADEHRQQVAQAEKETIKAAPYKHTPTHAAQDALSSAPTSWSVEESRAKIAAYHKRKSSLCRSNSEQSFRDAIMPTTSETSFQAMMYQSGMNKSKRHSKYSSPLSHGGDIPPVPTLPIRYGSSGQLRESYASSSRSSNYNGGETSQEDFEISESVSSRSGSSSSSTALDARRPMYGNSVARSRMMPQQDHDEQMQRYYDQMRHHASGGPRSKRTQKSPVYQPFTTENIGEFPPITFLDEPDSPPLEPKVLTPLVRNKESSKETNEAPTHTI